MVTEPSGVIALTMQQHLPVMFEDYRTLCLCDVGPTFEGPVFHREHVAERIIDALASAGFGIVSTGPTDPIGPM